MKLPVLILPGFASSGLEVIESDINGEEHKKDRVWMNPVALGIAALHFGDAYKEEHEVSKKKIKDDVAHDDRQHRLKPKLGFLKQEKYETALECRSAWIHHLSLAEDHISERGSNKVRPIPGLDGVDFLTDIASIKVGASFVFGPVIEALVEAGYEKGKDLDAAPYDFRLPPSILQQRDEYFTNTMEKIEEMYAKNDELPVVLLCHSLGCKTGHYLLNFAKANKGQEWIDQYIHTYMPVGAPHIGAREMVIQEFSPSTGSPVDTMMSEEEKLVLFRSWGSCVWMMPRVMPSRTLNSPGLICREEGNLEITVIDYIGDCDTLVRTEYGTRAIEGLRLHIDYGNKQKVRSALTMPSDEKKKDGFYFHFGEKFMFSTSADALNENTKFKPMRLTLQEPGSMLASEREQRHWLAEGMQFFDAGYWGRQIVGSLTEDTDLVYTELAITRPITNLHELLAAVEPNADTGCYELELDVPIYARADTTEHTYAINEGARNIIVKLNIKWSPPPSMHTPDPQTTPIAELPENSQPMGGLPVVSSENENYQYQRVSGQHLLREGMGDSFFKLVQNQYEDDEFGPRQVSAVDAPPVKRVYAIYGINVATPDGAFFKRPEAMVLSEPYRVKHRFELDESVNIALEQIQPDTNAFGNYEVREGKIWEVPHKTPQTNIQTGEPVYCSGDGTVPYWSLQHVWTWHSSDEGGCNVRVEEVEGAVHRDILADRRFHRLLIDYVGGEAGVKEFEHSAAMKMQKLMLKTRGKSFNKQHQDE